MRAPRLVAALFVLSASGCLAEPETTLEDAWGALDQEELRVTLRIRGTVARATTLTAPPPADQLAALVRQQLSFAKVSLAGRALVEPTVDDVRLDGAEIKDGRLVVRWTARVSTKRPAGSPSEEATTLAFDLSLPEDPVDVLARGGATCVPEGTVVETEAALADAFDPTRMGCTIAVSAVEAEVTDATAVTADARACRPTGVSIATGSWSNATYGFSFLAKIDVLGAGFADCEIRQLATVRLARSNWDGTPIPRDELLKIHDRGLWDGVETGRWVVDTNWDWARVRDDGKHVDSQLHNITNRKGTTADGLRRTEVQLERTTRRFMVQVRDRATGSMRAIKLWRYTWDNEAARVPGTTWAGADIAIGRFTDCVGITGLGALNDPADGCL